MHTIISLQVTKLSVAFFFPSEMGKGLAMPGGGFLDKAFFPVLFLHMLLGNHVPDKLLTPSLLFWF